MVDIHYFIFIINADSAIYSVVVFLVTYLALRLIYRMWRRSLRCPHCGEIYHAQPVAHIGEKALPNTLWT